MKITVFEGLWSGFNAVFTMICFFVVVSLLPLPITLLSANSLVLFMGYTILVLLTSLVHGEEYNPLLGFAHGIIFALLAWSLNVTGYVPGAFAVLGFFLAYFASHTSFILAGLITEETPG